MNSIQSVCSFEHCRSWIDGHDENTRCIWNFFPKSM